MTFGRFEEIVKEKHAQVKIYPHGEFAGNKINVAVVFNPNGRVYQYNGTYCEVLNKLGIKAIYKHTYDSIVSALKKAKETHGKECPWFGDILDNSREIKEYTERLEDINKNYIIV